ncbi:MAG: DNA mismatch repair endonuclease MutL [Chloroflexi bacterium]|nr:DNA mismatch repair endonuclease MutL [Chloroflexota bacterium]MCL5076110.1 DNA mismatch repair endonuclease MutL [Chloroflexota bacterium]
MPIQVLSEAIIGKIAAGEVIERPVSVVKELLENAIDAGATQIRVETRRGGLELIRVIDDGVGIPANELDLALQRYATSKIQDWEDLTNIRTLGFRGEALPSIAAVADVTIVSRTASDRGGIFVTVKGGKIEQRGHQAAPLGTMVTVRNLFQNVPARLKFLKSANTEASHISHLVGQYALAYPEIRFSLLIEGRVSFQSAGTGDLRDVLLQLYGVETAEAMLMVDSSGFGSPNIRVDGCVSPPNITRATRAYLSFFINRRCVQNRMLAFAVEDAYRSLLADGRHPIVVLNVHLPGDQIDVNVHPRKAEVRFLNEHEVFSCVQRAVRQSLTSHLSLPAIISRSTAVVEATSPRLQFAERESRPPLFPEETPNQTTTEPLPRTEGGLPLLRVLGQLGNTFIVAEGPDGLYLIDQHRAHERVLYERLREERAEANVHSQLFLEPLTVDLTPRQMSLVSQRLPQLAEMGFALEPFGEQSFLLRAIPSILSKADIVQTVNELIDELAEEKDGTDWLEDLIVMMSCKGAIKAGQSLSMAEMRELLLQLERVSIAPRCPHGAPTMVRLSQHQLERQFDRR